MDKACLFQHMGRAKGERRALRYNVIALTELVNGFLDFFLDSTPLI
jgi:hypothetical protein